MKHARTQRKDDIFCPCIDYDNKLAWVDTTVITRHLIKWGFKKNYTIWTEHGELSTCHVLDTEADHGHGEGHVDHDYGE